MTNPINNLKQLNEIIKTASPTVGFLKGVKIQVLIGNQQKELTRNALVQLASNLERDAASTYDFNQVFKQLETNANAALAQANIFTRAITKIRQLVGNWNFKRGSLPEVVERPAKQETPPPAPHQETAERSIEEETPPPAPHQETAAEPLREETPPPPVSVNIEKPPVNEAPAVEENPEPVETKAAHHCKPHTFEECVAIHATDIFPNGGLMIPGAMTFLKNKQGVLEEFSREAYRQTLHWSLNQIAPTHEGGSWYERKIAILTPLSALSDRLVSISAMDSFVLGTVQLDQRFTVVAAQTVDTSSLPQEVNLVTFDPTQNTLREMVAQETRKLGGNLYTSHETIPDTVSVVVCAECSSPVDKNLFQPLFEKYPVISYGDHMRSETGEAWRFGQLENIFENFTKIYLHAPHISNSLMFHATTKEYDWLDFRTLGSVIENHLQQLEKTYGENEPSIKALKAQAEKWKQHMLAEEWFQIRCGNKTFQRPSTVAQVQWIQENILERDLSKFTEEEKKAFLEEASSRFRRQRYYENSAKLPDQLGSMMNGDPWTLMNEWGASPRSLGKALLNRWYMTGSKTALDEAKNARKIAFYTEMFNDLQTYREAAERKNPLYAERAQEICKWLVDFIREEIKSRGEAQFKSDLMIYSNLNEKTIESYLQMLSN